LFLCRSRLIQSVPSHSVSKRSILVSTYHLCTLLPSNLFLQVSRPGASMHCFSPPALAVCLSLSLSLSLISFFLLLSPCEYLTMSTNCEASHCITFSIRHLLPLVHTQTSSLILRLGLYPFVNSVSISVAYGFGQLIFIKVLMHKNKADGSYKP
jgi:hypothetical protein